MAEPSDDKFLFPLAAQAGVKRDGTQLDGNFFTEAVWTRFRNGRPKKMGGYREIVNGLEGPISQLYVQANHPDQLVYTLGDTGIQMTTVDSEGSGGSPVDRTPVGFTTGFSTQWQVDAIFDTTGSSNVKIVAHRGDGSHDGDESTNYPVYYGVSTATTAFVTTGESVSGGCVVLQPYLFIYGNNGLIKNSVANDVTLFTGGDANEANVSGTKVVRGIPIRGGSNAPAGLFWALDSVIRVSYVGGSALWRYDTITAKSTILSAAGAIDYDGTMYWAGVDRFFLYNGVVKELPNPLNQDFFFDNLNFAYRSKVWATSVPRWGEIWWFFPKGASTVCNHAIVFNVREGTWYDTPIYRSAGFAPRLLYFPVWADSLPNDRVDDDKYALYRHETGTDHVYGEEQVAIDSYFTTPDIGLAGGGPVQDQPQTENVWTRITRIEPDFVQSGEMTVEVLGSVHAQSEEESSTPLAFEPDTGKVDIRQQRRLLQLRFRSNTQGGNFFMGRVIMHLERGDVRE